MAVASVIQRLIAELMMAIRGCIKACERVMRCGIYLRQQQYDRHKNADDDNSARVG